MRNIITGCLLLSSLPILAESDISLNLRTGINAFQARIQETSQQETATGPKVTYHNSNNYSFAHTKSMLGGGASWRMHQESYIWGLNIQYDRLSTQDSFTTTDLNTVAGFPINTFAVGRELKFKDRLVPSVEIGLQSSPRTYMIAHVGIARTRAEVSAMSTDPVMDGVSHPNLTGIMTGLSSVWKINPTWSLDTGFDLTRYRSKTVQFTDQGNAQYLPTTYTLKFKPKMILGHVGLSYHLGLGH